MPPGVVVCHRVDRATRVRRWALRVGTVLLGAIGGLLLVSAAHAFWSTGGTGLGLAATGTMGPPTDVVASSPLGSDSVSVSWSPSALPGGTVDGYYVTRMPAEGGEPSPACGTSPTVLNSGPACYDLEVPDGSYRYLVTAVLGTWTEESAPSNEVTVRFNSGAPSVVASTSPAPNANGYNNSSPVTVQLTATDSDGVASITYRINGGTPVTVSAATTSIPLSGNGTFTVTYSATDTLGATSATGTRVVRIDTIAPAAPAAPTLTTASDTGTSSTDRITNDRTPTFTGTAEPGATVRLYSSGTLVGSAVASVNGTYVVTSGTLLAEGTRSITVRVVDLAGNVGALSAATSITIDVTGPSVSPATLALLASSDTGRSSNDRITADNTPDMSGSARNSGADALVLFAGSTQVGWATATPTATVTASTLADGTHEMTMRGSDVAGNLSPASTSLSITIDTVAPQAPSAPALTAASDTGASSTDRYTSDTTPTLTGTNEAAATVTVFAGASQVGSQLTAATSYTVTSSTLTEGVHVLTATATDVAGNVGPASAGTSITVDTTAPQAPTAPTMTTASDSGTSSSDRVTNVTTPTFTGTAATGTNVRLYAGATATGPLVNAASGGWTITTDTLQDGTYAVTARTDPDLAGNVGISPSTSVTIDTVAPGTPAAPSLVTASDSGRSSTDGITNVKTPTFFDSGSTGVVGVRLFDNGVQVGSSTASPSYMVTSSTLSDGVHPMTVRVFDLAGNVSVSSAVRSVTIDTVAPAAPSAPSLTAASDSGSSSTDRVTNVTTPTVTGTNEASALVTVFSGAAQVGTHTTTTTSYSVTTSTLAEGVHSLTATATDVAGNAGPASAGTSVTIDTTAPAAPSAPVLAPGSDSGVSATDRITNVATPTLTGTGTAGTNVRLFDGGTATGPVVVANGGSYTITAGTLASGTRTLTARTDPDVAGNVGISAATTVTIDTTAPTVAIGVDSIAAVRFSFSFTETVHGFVPADVSLSGTANPTTSTLSGTNPSYLVQVSGMNRTGTVVANLGAGQVTDTAGNGNPASTSSTNVINYQDTVAPAVSITQLTTLNGNKVVAEGTAGTSPGDPSTITVVLCTSTETTCSGANTRATLTATVDPVTGAWSVTSSPLGPTPTVYARAFATDLTGNTRVSSLAGPVSTTG